MAAPNIVNVTNILGRTAVQVVGLTPTAIVANAAGSNKVIKINSLIISNVDGTSNAELTVDLFRSSVAYRIANTVVVPADASLVVISKDANIYLEEGDSLRLTANVVGDLEGVCSYEEIS
jgi:hypothetical protein